MVVCVDPVGTQLLRKRCCEALVDPVGAIHSIHAHGDGLEPIAGEKPAICPFNLGCWRDPS